MISFLINSLGLVAFLALVIYGVHADFEDDAADSIAEFDLLSVALAGMENFNNGGVKYVESSDGIPVYAITSAAILKSPARLIMPVKLDEFSLMVMMQTSKPPKGFLFAVVNSLETVIQFGVKVSTTLNNNLNISLVYNDPHTKTGSESLVSFSLPYDLNVWIKFEIQVTNEKIALFHDCIKVHEVNVTKEPRELVFESASTFYLAQAGKLEQKFECLCNILQRHAENLGNLTGMRNS